MKVLVAVKRVVDSSLEVHLKSNGSGIDKESVKMSMNPFDEVAIEEAFRLREKDMAREVIVVSCGSIHIKETLQVALAMGADRGIFVETENDLDPLPIAKLLRVLCELEKPDLILLGKQTTDEDGNQVGQMLAELLDIGQATSASKIAITKKNNNSFEAHVDCEIDSGVEKMILPLPGVITVDLSLNEPRYITLPNIIRAKKKTLKTVTPDELGVDISSKLQIMKVIEPPSRSDCLMIENVESLIEKLKNEAKVL